MSSPIQRLPTELLLPIFDAVAAEEHGNEPTVYHIVNAMKTCRMWHQVGKTPSLWTSVPLDRHPRITRAFFKNSDPAVIKVSGEQRYDLCKDDWRGFIRKVNTKSLAKHLHRVRSLDIRVWEDADGVNIMLDIVNLLKERNPVELRHLNLWYWPADLNPGSMSFCQKMPRLQTLYLRGLQFDDGLSQLHHLRQLRLLEVEAVSVSLSCVLDSIRNCMLIQKLQVDTRQDPGSDDESGEMLATPIQLPDLKWISIDSRSSKEVFDALSVIRSARFCLLSVHLHAGASDWQLSATELVPSHSSYAHALALAETVHLVVVLQTGSITFRVNSENSHHYDTDDPQVCLAVSADKADGVGPSLALHLSKFAAFSTYSNLKTLRISISGDMDLSDAKCAHWYRLYAGLTSVEELEFDLEGEDVNLGCYHPLLGLAQADSTHLLGAELALPSLACLRFSARTFLVDQRDMDIIVEVLQSRSCNETSTLNVLELYFGESYRHQDAWLSKAKSVAKEVILNPAIDGMFPVWP